MSLADVKELLEKNSYPGRGIILGKSDDGRNAVIIYFIMGRSENSRNRIFVEEGEGIRTQAFDHAKLTDPSLVIYAPVRLIEKKLIVTNGDQTDTIYEFLNNRGSFEEALRARTFEPDEPNFTPRISGILDFDNGYTYKLSIIKSFDGNPSSVLRFFYEYSFVDGVGHFIHTYQQDGSPLPSFEGEPIAVLLRGGIDEIAKETWLALNEDNKVSLFVRFVDLETGKYDTRIVNRHE